MPSYASKIHQHSHYNIKSRKENTFLLLANEFSLQRVLESEYKNVTWAYFVRFEVLMATGTQECDAVYYGRWVSTLTVRAATSSHTWHISTTRLRDVTPHKTVALGALYSALFSSCFFFLPLFSCFMSSFLYPFLSSL
jgi:hypothetical protein